MDVRLSAEQEALRDSVAQVVERLGPKAVGQLEDRERIAKLDAAVDASGWRELRTAADDGSPWAPGVETAIIAEELARGVADAAAMDELEADVLREVDEAVAFTDASPFPAPTVAFDDLYADSVYTHHTFRDTTFAVLEPVR